MRVNMIERERLTSLIKLAGLVGASMGAASGLVACAGVVATKSMPNRTPARFVTYDAFPSAHVAARKVVVWLPPDYDASSDRCAVLYMHDGQNLFDAATAMGGQTWGVAEHLTNLQATGKIRKTIVVGIANTSARWREYAPAAAVRPLSSPLRSMLSRVPGEGMEELLSDKYLQFIVDELKPFVDANFRTKPGRDDTFVMGSSMGGLISLYALATYPKVFGGAGCVSTHWPIATNPNLLTPSVDPRVAEVAASYVNWLEQHLPVAGEHRVYFDHGSINLDSLYAPYQKNFDALMLRKAYRLNKDWMTQVFSGADHNEKSWRERLHLPLQFLLRPD